MSLDEKLKDVLTGYINMQKQWYAGNLDKDTMEVIKQSFELAGWNPPWHEMSVEQQARTSQRIGSINKLMSGREWYELFSKQFRGTPAGTIVTMNIDEIMKAAKEATGLRDKEPSEEELDKILIEYDQGKLPVFPGDIAVEKVIANRDKVQVARDYAKARLLDWKHK